MTDKNKEIPNEELEFEQENNLADDTQARYRFTTRPKASRGIFAASDDELYSGDTTFTLSDLDIIVENPKLNESIQDAESYISSLEAKIATGELDTPGSIDDQEQDSAATVEISAIKEQAEEPQSDELDSEFAELANLAHGTDLVSSSEPEDSEMQLQTDAAPDYADLDESDVNLMMIFDMDKELKDKIGKERLDKIKRAREDAENIIDSVEGKEYNSPEQNKDFMMKFNDRFATLTARLMLASGLFLVVFMFEFFLEFLGHELPAIVAMNQNPELHLLFVVQLTLMVIGVSFRELSHAIKCLAKGQSCSEQILLASVAFNLVHQAAIFATGNIYGTQFYVIPLAFCAVLTLYFKRLNLKREILTFRTISTKRPKYAVLRLEEDESVLEEQAFGDDTDKQVYGVVRTDFISNFTARSSKRPQFAGAIGAILPAIVIVAAIFFVVGFYRGDYGSFVNAIAAAQLSVMLSLPLCALLNYSYPFFAASKKAAAYDSAIIGESALEEYSDVGIVSFNDRDIFPPSGVKVKSMKLQNNNTRIDIVLYHLSSVFSKLGGSLRDVFNVATKDIGHSDDVDIVFVERGGVVMAVDGENITIGNLEFMRSRGFNPTVDAEDPDIMNERQISIMHVAISGELAAKLYIEYKIDPEFLDIIKSLHRTGICMGIKTLDPNVDDAMLDQRISLSRYPIKIIKCQEENQMTRVFPTLDSGVVSRRSTKYLLKTLAMCSRVLQIIKTNTAVKIFSMLAGIAVTTMIVLFGTVTDVPSIFVLLFQLFWLIPIVVLTKLFL